MVHTSVCTCCNIPVTVGVGTGDAVIAGEPGAAGGEVTGDPGATRVTAGDPVAAGEPGAIGVITGRPALTKYSFLALFFGTEQLCNGETVMQVFTVAATYL